MNHRHRIVVAAAALFLLPACSNRLTGSFTINGAAFVPTSCRSGQVSGFTGVDLLDAAGNKIRLVATPSGQPMVYYVAAGQIVATPIGMCGALSVNRTNSRINNVYNVEGQATLACASPTGQVTGTVQYANCH